MSVVVVRPRALVDLAEIWSYIADDNPANADAIAALIDNKFQALASQSGMGRSRPELGEGLRSFGVGRYVIFYLSFSGGIEIVRVLHGARDIETVFEAKSVFETGFNPSTTPPAIHASPWKTGWSRLLRSR